MEQVESCRPGIDSERSPLRLPKGGAGAHYWLDMNIRIHWILLAAVACAIAAGYYFWRQSETGAPRAVPTAPPEVAPKPEVKPAPQIQFPVPQAGEPASLPSLEQSDSSMRTTLAELFGRSIFEEYFSPQNIVRRIVATVDNLPREKVAQRLMPVKPAGGPLVLAGEGENRVLGAGNAARYLPYVVMAESVDVGKLVAAYVHFYPLFQQAYGELGYPTEYFNDRLVQVIDHLLAAPEIEGPVALVQRKVLYEFADPELEARSAGQKILMRIGAGNAARVKARLRDIRRELAGRPAKP